MARRRTEAASIAAISLIFRQRRFVFRRCVDPQRFGGGKAFGEVRALLAQPCGLDGIAREELRRGKLAIDIRKLLGQLRNIGFRGVSLVLERLQLFAAIG